MWMRFYCMYNDWCWSWNLRKNALFVISSTNVFNRSLMSPLNIGQRFHYMLHARLSISCTCTWPGIKKNCYEMTCFPFILIPVWNSMTWPSGHARCYMSTQPWSQSTGTRDTFFDEHNSQWDTSYSRTVDLAPVRVYHFTEQMIPVTNGITFYALRPSTRNLLGLSRRLKNATILAIRQHCVTTEISFPARQT